MSPSTRVKTHDGAKKRCDEIRVMMKEGGPKTTMFMVKTARGPKLNGVWIP